MARAMLCKTSKTCKRGETRGRTNEIKSKLVCILEASESTRLRMEESLPNWHEDHIAGRGDNLLQHDNLVHKFILKPWRFTKQKQQWMKDGKIWENFGVGLDESQKQKRGDRWSKDEGRKSSFCLTDGHVSSEKCWIRGKAPKIQRSSCIPRRYCERWFWTWCSIHRTRIISITNDSNNSHGYHIQTTKVHKTNSWRSICCNPCKNGRCSENPENSQIGVSRHLDSSTTTQMD